YRIIQVSAVVLWTSQIALSGLIFILLVFTPSLWVLVVPYSIWILFIDDAQNRGGRTVECIRKLSFWKLFGSYFPISLVKTVDLPGDRKYIFGYHPHGIIGLGAAINFGSEATGFSQKFPGLNPHLLTLKNNFLMPFYRDLILSLGLCSVSMKSCVGALNSKNPYRSYSFTSKNESSLSSDGTSADKDGGHTRGNCLIIVVGGAEESLMARPGTSDLVLKKRLGFIRLAIKEGADLVPVFSFGENEIYDQLVSQDGSVLSKLQKGFKRLFGFTFPIFYGRGLFGSGSIGLLPHRRPIVSVVGKPIRVERMAEVSEEEVLRVQHLYIDELKWVWEKYKDVYATGRKSEIQIVA
ncbi:diacylglycerol acyltransferase, partial [Phakopsora pachyrhizi]